MPTRLLPTPGWTLDAGSKTALDPRLAPLLAAVRARGSLAAAVVACGLSYRAGWDLLVRYAELFGTPLVALERGRGARLSPLGEALSEGLARAERTMAKSLARLSFDLPGPDVPRAGGGGAPQLRIAASHDLALAALAERLAGSDRLTVELRFRGSLESLAALAHGEVDLAGFHIATEGEFRQDPAPFRRWLDPRRHRLITFVRREQGLIVARGNPMRLRRLDDIARSGARFVNRQRGSGTRLLVDGLLEQAGLAAASLTGYRNEEFTHAAVAATIAAGRADAGFGVRAAAAQFGLGFVSLCRERYSFAIRTAMLARPEISAWQRLLGGAQLRQIIAGLAGYAPDHPGKVAEIGDAFGTTAAPRARPARSKA